MPASSRSTGRLDAGDPVGFFPEGTLHRMPGLLPFRLGAFSVAVEAHARVVPVIVSGSRSVLRDGYRIPRPGVVRIRIASPVASPDDESELAPERPGTERPEAAEGRAPDAARSASSADSSWARAVKLRDAARAVILAQCGEPDLGARHDVLDALRRRTSGERS